MKVQITVDLTKNQLKVIASKCGSPKPSREDCVKFLEACECVIYKDKWVR